MPLLVRGPGLRAGSTLDAGAVLGIDLAPTFLEWGGAADLPRYGMDGAPAGNLLAGAAPPAPRAFLVEYHGEQHDGCAASLAAAFPGFGFSLLDDGLNCGRRGPLTYATPPLWGGNETWSSIQDSANNTYRCVRAVRPPAGPGPNAVDVQFCAWESGEAECFDLVQDPWQVRSPPSKDLRIVSV